MSNLDDKHEGFFSGLVWTFATIIIISLLVLMWTGCKKKDTTYQESAITTANKAQIDSLSRELVIRDSIILGLQNANVASEKKQSDISKSFKPVYDKINNADSVELLNQLTVLLAETKRFPLKRD